MKRVLVVDDSATMRRMIMASLRGVHDLAFDQAVSGLEAIERITLAPVDLVVLDLNMPDVHGLEVLQCRMERRAAKETGVKAVTALKGREVWKAGDQGLWSKDLLEEFKAPTPKCSPNRARTSPPAPRASRAPTGTARTATTRTTTDAPRG